MLSKAKFRLLPTHSSVNFCPILKNWVSKFKLRSSLTSDTKFSDLSVFRITIYDFKLVYFILGHPVSRKNVFGLSFLLRQGEDFLLEIHNHSGHTFSKYFKEGKRCKTGLSFVSFLPFTVFIYLLKILKTFTSRTPFQKDAEG